MSEKKRRKPSDDPAPAESWPSTPEIDGHTYAPGPPPAPDAAARRARRMRRHRLRILLCCLAEREWLGYYQIRERGELTDIPSREYEESFRGLVASGRLVRIAARGDWDFPRFFPARLLPRPLPLAATLESSTPDGPMPTPKPSATWGKN